jgi:hypothetical protein
MKRSTVGLVLLLSAGIGAHVVVVSQTPLPLPADLVKMNGLISVSIREHKGKRGGREGNPGRTRGRQRIAGPESVSERQKSRQFAACPEFRICGSGSSISTNLRTRQEGRRGEESPEREAQETCR